MTYLSLFSGIGGFDLGLDRAGHQCVVQVEIDKDCNRVLAHHWPSVERCQDVTKYRGRVGAAELVCGGFPCQDLSVAGKRAGLAGKRSGLWGEFRRVIAEIRPAWVLIENVPGLLSSNQGRDMGTVLGGLAELGYWWAYRVLDLQYFRVPQRRRRVFIVGCLGNRAGAAQVLFEPESCDGNPAPSREAGEDLAGCLGGGAAGRGWNDDTDRAGAFVASDYANGAFEEDETARPLTRSADRTRAAPIVGTLQAHKQRHGHAMSTQQAAESGQLIASTLRSRPRAAAAAVNAGGQRRQDFETENLVCCTIPASTSPARRHTTGNKEPLVGGIRRLTPLECSRLQSFPDNWLDIDPPLSDSAKYRCLGNAVPPIVVEWIGRRIMEAAQCE